MKQKEKDILEEIVKKESGAINYDVRIEMIQPEIGNIGGSNSLKSNEIYLYVSPNFNINEETKEYLQSKKEEPSILSVIKDIVRHEIGHWEYPIASGRGCPYDWFLAEEIFNGTERGLSTDKKQLKGYVANAFMDIVDNVNVAFSLQKNGWGSFAGQVVFYYDQGMAVRKYSPFYDFFVRIQEELWMDEIDKNYLKRFHSKNQKVEECMKEFFKELKLLPGKENIERNLKTLMKKYRWEEMAEIFARISSPLLDVAPKESLTGGEMVGKESRFEKKLRDPNFLEKVVRKRWEEGKEFPSYLEEYKALGYLYRSLAKEIPIRTYTYTENLDFPVVGYGRKSSDFSRRIGINEEGKLEFKEPKYYWSMTIPVKRGIGSIPNLYFILDCSGSMGEEEGKPIYKWGDESKYHYALLGFYGILNYLNIAKLVPEKIAVTSFSNSSRSAIEPYHRLDEIEKILFTPQFGGTYLDSQEVVRISNQLGKSVIIMLSDGEIHNWEEIKETIKKVMSNNSSAFISIREKSAPFYDLRNVAKVFYVDKASDLPNIILDFTKEKYKGN